MGFSLSPVRPVSPARDLVLLLARIGLGVVFIAHGWQKHTGGVDATTQAFTGMGIPAPRISAYFATYVELVGGAALIAGVLTTVVGVLLAVDMVGAFVFVHAGKGVLASNGGWELVGALGLLSLVLVVVGPGRASVDAWIGRAPSRSAVASSRVTA